MADAQLALRDGRLGRATTPAGSRSARDDVRRCAWRVREMRASWRRLLFFFICLADRRRRDRRAAVGHPERAAGVCRRGARAHHRRRHHHAATRPFDAGARRHASTSACAAAGATSHRVGRDRDDGAGGRSRAAGARAMVELRAVEPGFPYYGALKLAGGQAYSTTRCCADCGVLVRPELLAQLGLRGRRRAADRHAAASRFAASSRPSRAAGWARSASARACSSTLRGPASRPACSTFGSRASLSAPGQGAGRRARRARRRRCAATSRTSSRASARTRRTEDDIGEDFARAENYLSLVGLVIVILGGIGVSSVTRVFVAAEDHEHRHPQVRGRAARAAAGDLHGAGARARAGRQRARRAARGAAPSRRFRATLAGRRPRPASTSTTA